jgi:hypothetical protein|tara:strand:- start:496 stop:1713 length:1218 start_codon:yes stop_codon:yes gene_type:complete
MAFFFSRDTKVFMEWSEDGTTAQTALYEIPVLDGFSFSQGTNTSEITLSEAATSAGYSKRGRAMFTDSFAPAEWSFNTYMRPTKSGSNAKYVSGDHADANAHFAVEGPLWAAMGATDYDKAVGGDAFGGTSSQVFDFANSNNVQVGAFNMYFVLGAAKDSTSALYTTGTDGVTIYKLADCSVGSASMDFDIEGIAQVGWSGNGKTIEEAASLNTEASGATAKGLIREGVDTTSNFIRQKLTDLSLTYDASEVSGAVGSLGSSDTTFAVTLTGGNITIENNNTYLTPETIGTVNLPLGHVTGTRSVSGNFTCYLNDVANGSLDLFEKLQESRGVITNAFAMTFSIGGSSNTPRVAVTLPKAHLELPTHDLSDVISVDVAFHGLSSDLSSATAANATNEVSVTYVGA